MELICDAVFEGGGVKGIGFSGAISSIERAGYSFQNVVGTSAGAIAAALIAVGCDSAEIEYELNTVDYKKFSGRNFLDYLGVAGKAVNTVCAFGIYDSDYFEEWLNGILQKKHKLVFGDIRTGYDDEKYEYRFQAIASDLTDREMLVLPGDLRQFGIDPDNFSIAKAVRMSMSIPVYYKPVRLKAPDGNTHIIVDGGLLSNYPIWILDDGTSDPPWPTFGLKFISDQDTAREKEPIGNIFDYSKSVVSTMLEAHDKYHVSTSKGDFQRTIIIPTCIQTDEGQKCINTTYFDITPSEKKALFQNGKRAAEKFLDGWNFNEWKRIYREK